MSTQQQGDKTAVKTAVEASTTKPARKTKIKMGPNPTLLSRKEVEALYDMMEILVECLNELKVDYIITGGSLLGAVRQHSVLFCDDDIDIAIISEESYEKVYHNLAGILSSKSNSSFIYTIRPWPGGDKIRHKRYNNVFIDLFTLRRYNNREEFDEVIGIKQNGKKQPQAYIDSIYSKMEKSAFAQGEKSSIFPMWHFNTRKSIEMWTKEVYREHELFPLEKAQYRMGPLFSISGPRMPILLLKRAFGDDCFDVYYPSCAHTSSSDANSKQELTHKLKTEQHHEEPTKEKSFQPKLLAGGTWEQNEKCTLEEEHYIPMQPITRTKRVPTDHNKTQLFQFIERQSQIELNWRTEHENQTDNVTSVKENVEEQVSNNHSCSSSSGQSISDEKAKKHNTYTTVYMDGVFDLFHVGHLEAINQCVKLGDRVIIGVTGDEDASGYKRPPIISQDNRIAVVKAIKGVDKVICPCPLIVTNEFMDEHQIDLVVHGYRNEEDAQNQGQCIDYPTFIELIICNKSI